MYFQWIAHLVTHFHRIYPTNSHKCWSMHNLCTWLSLLFFKKHVYNESIVFWQSHTHTHLEMGWSSIWLSFALTHRITSVTIIGFHFCNGHHRLLLSYKCHQNFVFVLCQCFDNVFYKITTVKPNGDHQTKKNLLSLLNFFSECCMWFYGYITAAKFNMYYEYAHILLNC